MIYSLMEMAFAGVIYQLFFVWEKKALAKGRYGVEAYTLKVEEVGGILKRIGNYSPETFESSFSDRLIFQKTIYLLQAFGLYLGYYFSWYIHGPYSITLTKDGFALID